jgi:hypothetical protein
MYSLFKCTQNLEEYFYNKYLDDLDNFCKEKINRIYIPIKWSNIKNKQNLDEFQNDLNNFIKYNPSDNGYFIVTQIYKNVILKLPQNTKIFSSDYGDYCIPFIYSIDNTIYKQILHKSFIEKKILCSYIEKYNYIKENKNFKFIEQENKKNVIQEIINSKFTLITNDQNKLKMFEVFNLGTIPVYIWDDFNWIPITEFIDYSKFMIVLHINDVNKLESLLLNIDEKKYNEMLYEYTKVKHWFSLDGMYNIICHLFKKGDLKGDF